MLNTVKSSQSVTQLQSSQRMTNTQYRSDQLAQRIKNNKNYLPRVRKASGSQENQRRILSSRHKKSFNSTETNSKREFQACSPHRIFIRKASTLKISRIPTVPTLPTIPSGSHVIRRKRPPLSSKKSSSPKYLNPVRTSEDIDKIKHIPTPGGESSGSDSSIRRLIILS